MDLKKIEEQLKKVPDNIKKLFFSVTTANIIRDIGEENGLMLDQIDDLIAEVGLTIIGIKTPSLFVNNITKILNIKEDLAKKISGQVNTRVLSQIKDLARREDEMIDEQSQKTKLTDLERIGNFTVEKHGEIPKFEKPAPAEKASPAQGNTHVEAIVENLLTTPNIQHEQIINKSASVNNGGVSINPSTDPYREEF